MTTTGLDAVGAAEAAAGAAGKEHYVRRMFSDIAPRYDLLNHLLSLNVDRRWRRAAVRELQWQRNPRGVYLDLCAGTLDIAAALATSHGFTGLVIGADFAEPMLARGKGKAPASALAPLAADALRLPLPNDAASGVIIAFGARNLSDLAAGLREVHRVLADGGRCVILELSTPKSAAVRVVYHAYFRHLLPFVGRLLSGHDSAYAYLPASVTSFPDGDALARLMHAAGFAEVHWRSLSLGVAAIHVGVKRPAERQP